jgi:TMEM175 potassium channel family protein
MRTERGLDRFITFLDAVVAIAITLLVLPLTEIIVGTHPPPHATEVFTQNGARFWSFLLSFAVIFRLWLGHHRIIERVGAYDTVFVWVNLGWALTVVFLPFATQLTSAYPAYDRLAIASRPGTRPLGRRWPRPRCWRSPLSSVSCSRGSITSRCSSCSSPPRSSGCLAA